MHEKLNYAAVIFARKAGFLTAEEPLDILQALV